MYSIVEVQWLMPSDLAVSSIRSNNANLIWPVYRVLKSWWSQHTTNCTSARVWHLDSVFSKKKSRFRDSGFHGVDKSTVYSSIIIIAIAHAIAVVIIVVVTIVTAKNTSPSTLSWPRHALISVVRPMKTLSWPRHALISVVWQMKTLSWPRQALISVVRPMKTLSWPRHALISVVWPMKTLS